MAMERRREMSHQHTAKEKNNSKILLKRSKARTENTTISVV